jgi:hypothetical protein
VLDVEAQGVRVEFTRVEYDLEAAMAGIRGSGLPAEFAEYLATGGSAVRRRS